MNALLNTFDDLQLQLATRLRHLDGLVPLAMRLYLAPVFWVAGTNKLSGMDNVIEWFGNPDWGLGLPFPTVMAYAAAYTETIGAVLLVLGLAVRWISIPLIITMVVATFAVHWDMGWAAIADSNAQDVAVRLGAAREILQEHGNYRWLTEKGGFVILNNGIEFAVTYMLMCFGLLAMGGGRYVSLDYWLGRWRR